MAHLFEKPAGATKGVSFVQGALPCHEAKLELSLEFDQLDLTIELNFTALA